MSLITYPPAVYTIVNDSSTSREIIVDNNPVGVYRKTMMTIVPEISLKVNSSIMSANTFEVRRIGGNYENVIGNTTTQD